MAFPSLSDIAYFIEVAQTQNISRAAERIGITQPSLSQAMKRLEATLDCNLFIRGRLGIRLTPAGKEFFSRSKSLLSQWEQICENVQKNESEVVGKFKIGCHPSVGLYTLSRFLPTLIKENRGLKVDLIHGLSREIAEGVASCDVDYGIVINPVSNPEFVIKKLGNDDVTLWVSKKIFNLNNFNPFEHTLICDPDLHQVQSILKKIAKKPGSKPGRKKESFTNMLHSSNLEIVTDLVKSGVGIGILPRRVATKDPEHDLVELSEYFGSCKDQICLVFRSDLQRTLAHKTIVSSIKQSFKS